MKKILLTTIFLTGLIFLFSVTVNAADIAQIKDVIIEEQTDNITLNISSTKQIPYNITNYNNGDIGIRLPETALNSNIQDDQIINLIQQKDISGVQVFHDEPYEIELRLSGNKNLSKQKN